MICGPVSGPRFFTGATSCGEGAGIRHFIDQLKRRGVHRAGIGYGVGALALVEAATERGITTFVADVLWENTVLLDALRDLGATIVPLEPGVARVEFDLPEPGVDLTGTAIHRLLVATAAASSS